jgi:glycosyltransferase involved in cell wall biosynthesis
MTPELHPTITFIVPVQNKGDSLIEQISTIFTLSERYQGFYEIIIVGNGTADTVLKLAWLAMKLNKIRHPFVRTRMIRYTAELNIHDLIETGINHALGQKIIIATNNPEVIELEKINDLMNREISITPYIMDANSLEKIQSNTATT